MSDEDEIMAKLQENLEKQNRIAERLVEKKGLPMITAIVAAGDIMSAERAAEMVTTGEWDVERALMLTGSYARLDLALSFHAKGWLSKEKLFEQLPELWRGSDPDDTDPRFLRMWREAWAVNGRRPIRDGRPLPKGKFIMVFRGQMPADRLGIAWSTDPKIAGVFARGAGVRTPIEGTVFKARIHRDNIYAYLTGRGESEVILDPMMLVPVETR